MLIPCISIRKIACFIINNAVYEQHNPYDKKTGSPVISWLPAINYIDIVKTVTDGSSVLHLNM